MRISDYPTESRTQPERERLETRRPPYDTDRFKSSTVAYICYTVRTIKTA